MTGHAEKRGQLIRHLEDALALSDEIEDGQTGYLSSVRLMKREHVNLGRSAEAAMSVLHPESGHRALVSICLLCAISDHLATQSRLRCQPL
jgi:hypothetical protein